MNLWQKLVVAIVRDSIIPKRHIANGKIEKAVRSLQILKALYVDIGIRIKHFGDVARRVIQFHTCKCRLVAQMRGNQPQKVTGTH